jgi:PAS domain S-box-containing protein
LTIPKNETGKCLKEIEHPKMRVAELDARKDCAMGNFVGDSTFQKVYAVMAEGLAMHQVLYNDGGEPVDYKILEVNPAYENITGLKREKAIGAKASELYGTGKPPYFEIYSRVAENGHTESFETYFEPMDKHFKIKVISPVKGLFATVFEDVTQQLFALQRLAESETMFRTIAETAVDSIFLKDTCRLYTFVNPAMCKLFNMQPEDLLFKTPEDIFDPKSAATIREVDEKVLQGHVVDELRPILVGKQIREFNTVQVPMKSDEGKVIGMVGIVRDVTEQQRKQADQRQKQKLEAIGTLAGGVAHEINNPINIISNFAELIQGMEVDERVTEYAGEIIKESDRIANIVTNLLKFSRKDQESHSPVLLGDIIETTMSLTHKILEKDGIRIETQIEDDLPKIKCRHQQIMQVLMNLITNARDALNEKYPKHDPAKLIKLHCSMFKRDRQRWQRVTVEDAGGGIPGDVIELIFDPFFTTKGRDKGTGLGLAVSHCIVKEHHGELSVDSNDGTTRLHMDLPVDNEQTLSTNKGSYQEDPHGQGSDRR